MGRLRHALREVRRVPFGRLYVVALTAAAAIVWQAGGTGALATMVLTTTCIVVITFLVAEPTDRPWLLAAALGAIVTRDLAAAALDLWSFANGRAGSVFQDDFAYLNVANGIARVWRGEADFFSSDPSLVNTYVEMAAGIFVILGRNPMALKLVNIMLATAAGILTYRTMRNLNLPGAWWGTALILFFPSTFLWSLVALKDAYAAAMIVIAMWTISEYLRSGRLVWHAGTVAALLALHDVRGYIVIILAVAWPLGLAICPGGRGRLRSAGWAAIGAAVVLVIAQPWTYYSSGLAAATFTRSAMAQQARTGFVEAQPIFVGPPGTEFVVSVGAPSPDLSGCVLEVDAGVELLVEGSQRAQDVLRGSRGPVRYVIVKSGDVVRIVESPPAGGSRLAPPSCPPTAAVTPEPAPTSPSPASPAPTPVSTPAPPAPKPASSVSVVVLTPDAQNVVATPPPVLAEDTLGLRAALANVTHLPTGAMYVLLAPFPLFARTALDLATIPEMLLWYATLIMAILGLWHLWKTRRLEFAYGALVMGAIALVLSLVEGNIGTLVRHRAMLIVVTVVFAGVGFDVALRWWWARRTRSPR